MKIREKKKLYESIMNNVSKIVKRHLNEELAVAQPEGTICIYDSTETPDYDDFREWWSDMYGDDEVPSVNSAEYQNYCADVDAQDYEDLMNMLKEQDDDNYNEYLVCGSISRWNGSSNGFDFYSNCKEAVEACGEDGYLKIFIHPDGYLVVHCVHHDGTNVYEIHELETCEEYDELREELDYGDGEVNSQDFLQFSVPMSMTDEYVFD